MVATAPHYLLLSETRDINSESNTDGFWRFVLQNIDGPELLEVSDKEPGVRGERLQLLAAIRGLEALGQPSRVTMITCSHYVTRGIRREMGSWRDNHWRWEHFGEMLPIKNGDLWQRLDRALQFHRVQCRSWTGGALDTIWSDSPNAPSSAGIQVHKSVGLGRRVLNGWIQAAEYLRNRTTIETLTGTSCA